jgi:hypothetical protein
MRWAVALVCLAAGCGDRVADRVADQPAPPADRDTWDVYTLQGNRAGYGHTTVRRVQHDGREALRIASLQRLAIQRFGQTARQEIAFESLETPEGRLIEFECAVSQGAAPAKTVGRVRGERLELETTVAGRTERKTLPWTADCGGPYAVESSLLQQPLKPGQRRTVRPLQPPLFEAVPVELAAADYEPVELDGRSVELLRVASRMKFADGTTIGSTVWCDRTGDVLRNRIDKLGMEVRRATQAEALSETAAANLDLGWDIAVKVAHAIPNAHQTRSVRYRVGLADGNPATLLAAGASQRVKSLGPTMAEVTVYAIRPGRKDGNAEAPADPPTDADRQPNSIVQSDDPAVVKLAAEAAGDEKDPWRTAVKLEGFVKRLIKSKNFTLALATAAEVARQPEGDCTEHAVLLAALARARGLPARAAMGLVYLADGQQFAYHMWTEIYCEGRWIPLDGTLGQGGIGAAHLKLRHSSLAGSAAYTAMLPVLEIAGKLTIEVLEIEGPK